jgi:hypothetical protein
MRTGRSRLAHGWELVRAERVPESLVREFLRPAIRAVPSSMAQRLGRCRIALVSELGDPATSSEWRETEAALEISVAATGIEEHDVALELLVCLGQVLWERLSRAEYESYWRLLEVEIREGVSGDIDERALAAKRSLQESLTNARSSWCLQQYGGASFAATAAEYIHALWHDVTVRTGPEYLPAPQLRRRLELLARWFPPDRGYRLFPARQRGVE